MLHLQYIHTTGHRCYQVYEVVPAIGNVYPALLYDLTASGTQPIPIHTMVP